MSYLEDRMYDFESKKKRLELQEYLHYDKDRLSLPITEGITVENR